MHRVLATSAVAAALLAAACAPDIPNNPPPDVVVARFDPAQSPPVVPSPNSLAIDPATGLLNVTPAPNASEADLAFIAWLNTLDGFPTTGSANATFTGELDESTVTADNVRVFDVTSGTLEPVEGYAPVLTEPGATDKAEDSVARINIPAPGGVWTPGHSYAVVLLGGEGGLKAADGRSVIGSTTWGLVKASEPLFTCEDLTAPVQDENGNPTECRATTEVIPSTFSEPNERIVDQAQKAQGLERLRRLYKPLLDGLVQTGVDRSDVALLWTFKVADVPVARFNPAAQPAQVPLPNDLAIDSETGLVNAPIDPTASPAQQEFTRDYLNSLDGFPVTAGGSARIVGRGLAGNTVNEQTVQVLNITPGATTQPDVTISYDEDTDEIVVAPPAGGWTKGERYAVVLTTGVQGDNGASLQASDVWGLVRSEHPLVSCEDLAAADCESIATIAAISNAQALALEGLRRAFKPVLDGLAAQGLAREQVALAWTFRIVSFAEATFDPGASVIPFPNNILLLPGVSPPKVNLPIPPNAPPTQAALLTGLNSLDGFSTIGPYISENSAERGALDISLIDETTLAAGARYLKLDPGGREPILTPCLNCLSSALPNGDPQTEPQQLQFITETPLNEQTTYGFFLTSALQDERGKKVIAAPAFALLRMENPLVDGEGKSLVSGVADANAQALEPLRQGHKAFIDALVASGVERRDLALAWTVRTQSTVSLLELLHDSGAGMMLPPSPVWAADLTDELLGNPKPAPFAAIGQAFSGEINVPYLLTGVQGTLNPMPTGWQTRQVPFLLTTPAGSPPAGGWPVVIFGHGLTSGRQTMLAIANTYAAAGQATIAIDHLFHGDRSDCRGVAAAQGLPSDDAACANPTTQECSAMTGRCVARSAATRAACDAGSVPGGLHPNLFCFIQGQGACAPDGQCEGGDFARNAQTQVPLISGWNFLDPSNLFATRDRFRAPVADLAQLARVVAASGTGSLEDQIGVTLDGSTVRYTGQSLGGIIGTLYVAASGGMTAPAVDHALLNVPGADPAGVLLSAPAFESVRNAFLGTLAAQGITPGTPQFDDFIQIARWILDPADPQSAAYALLHSERAPSGRAVLVQYITDDLVIPNPTTERLIQAANEGVPEADQVAVSRFDPSAADLPPAARHSFLLNGTHLPTTGAAQQEAAALMSSGTLPTP